MWKYVNEKEAGNTMDIKQAIALLQEENKTLILYHGEEIFSYTTRGVSPLTELYENKKDCSSFVAVDKVVGRGAAFMYLLLGIKRIHALVISEPALELLKKNQIEITYDKLVPFIQNRTRDGFCPMESATLSCENPLDAYDKIKRKQAQLAQNKN